VAEGAIYLRSKSDSTRLQAIVAALQRRPEVGAIFTQSRRLFELGTAVEVPSNDKIFEGVVPGTLSFDVARWGNRARSGDILVSANWSHAANSAGVPGTTTQEGVAGHGTASPYDIHNTLIAVGPDEHDGEIPTATSISAPTPCSCWAPSQTMTGRVIREALREGQTASDGRVDTTETVKTPDGPTS
jgi:hypothetical protein